MPLITSSSQQDSYFFEMYCALLLKISQYFYKSHVEKKILWIKLLAHFFLVYWIIIFVVVKNSNSYDFAVYSQRYSTLSFTYKIKLNTIIDN